MFNRRMRVSNVEDCKFGWEDDACGSKVRKEICQSKNTEWDF